MRDPERLQFYYDRLEELHKQYCPDWRISQFLMNFLQWFGMDPYYLEDNRFIEKVKEYCKATFKD